VRRADPPARRVLIVDPDQTSAAAAASALRGVGMEVQVVADAESGLRTLATTEPQVLLLELDLPGRDGAWLLRRLRDDYMGARPRVIAVTHPESIVPRASDLGVDAVILKPASAEALIAATSDDGLDERLRDPERLRELIRLSIMSGDIESAVQTLAKRVALIFRTSEAILVGAVGERQWIGCARGPVDESPEAPIWDRCHITLEAGTTVLVTDATGQVASLLAVPIESPGGARLGVIMLVDDHPRLFPGDLVDHLRALSGRLYAELAWRSVHERISADRDRLRESSLLDPMLPSVWTRAALDQALATDAAGAMRRREPLTVGVLDLRGLKQLNERYGHVVGDSALRHVAGLVRDQLRPADRVARFAGDALAVVLGGQGPSEARALIQGVLDTIATRPLLHGAEAIRLRVIAGLAALGPDDGTGEVALLRAAGAVRLAKRRREQLVVADPAMADDLALPGLAGQGLEAGTTLGGMYQILHEISRGAMGVVYRAEDLGLGRPVALKTLRPDLARDSGFVERFRTEAATLAALRHENLVQVYAFGQDGEDVYFVMELVEGEPLEDRIELAREEGRLMPLEQVERVTGEIADALDAMHRAGILHRDVKPANVLLDRVRDRAVLVDVGIAKRRGSPTDPAGTPGFTAPESFSGATEGPATDVYGLAATAYTLLGTSPPFCDESVEQIVQRQQREAPAPVTRYRPGLPAAVDAVLLRALDPQPSKRFPSASAFARALVTALREASPAVRAGLDALPGAPAPPAGSSSAPVEIGGAGIEVVVDEASGPSLSKSALWSAPTHVHQPEAQETPLARIFPTGARRSSTAPPGTVPREVGPPPGEPQTRGALFRAAFRVLGAGQGAAWVAHVTRRDPALGRALQPQNSLLIWHPTPLFASMLRAIAESGRDAHAFARELGRVATAATFPRFYGADPAALSPWQVLASADLFWHRYHSWGKVTVERAGDHGARVTIAGGPSDTLICACTTGILEEVVLLSGGLSSHVVEEACLADRAPACVFRATWQPIHKGV
jgi:diguanylate cyclase (GGDEF)-like protein